MEAQERTIIVSSSRAQRKYAIQSKATTLEEFKAECREAGIDYSGLTFVEAISNTELLNDNSLLPREVTFKGKKTNNLVFSLTAPRKNIGSGAMSRKEAYAKIKELGWQKDCIDQFGDNYTRVSTENLVKMIEAVEDCKEQKPVEKIKPVSCKNIKNDEDAPRSCKQMFNSKFEQLEYLLKEAVELLATIKSENTQELSEDDIDDILENF
jgi:hypothetical protein